MTDRPTVAVLGLGTMGSRMAHRLLAAGFPVTVYNRSHDKAAPLVAAGARSAETPRRAIEKAAVAIGMVADDRASREVWLGARNDHRRVQHAVCGVGEGALGSGRGAPL